MEGVKVEEVVEANRFVGFCYRGISRSVAWVDLILCCINMVYVVVIIAIMWGNDGIQDRQKIICGGQVVVISLSIYLAKKLLHSTNLFVAQESTALAKKWCTIWLLGCGTMILYLMFEIGLKVFELFEIEGNYESVAYFVKIAYYFIIFVLSLIILFRLGAFWIVFRYQRELTARLPHELQNLGA